MRTLLLLSCLVFTSAHCMEQQGQNPINLDSEKTNPEQNAPQNSETKPYIIKSVSGIDNNGNTFTMVMSLSFLNMTTQEQVNEEFAHFLAHISEQK